MPFEVGQFVTDYEILGVLGKGGMGAVYRVRNVISNRVEAMKVLLADVGAQAELGDRFISEIRTLARLEHPNIAKFHTAFKAENQLVMVMEFVEGFTLSDFARQGAIPIEQVLSYVSQILSALACAHENGVVHRDIKPSNIMVTPHGIVKLMDFGIAKSNIDPNLTRPGTTMGSMLYMSPEQVRCINVDARSDLYSLGIVLYELTAGKRPFEADNTFAILDAHLNVPPRPPIELNPQLPQALNEIILMAIEKDQVRRFQTAAAFRAALESVRQRPGSAAALPSKGGLDRDLAATIPNPGPHVQTVVESGWSANAAPAASPQYAHTIVEPVPGNRPSPPGAQQSFGSEPQPRSVGAPPAHAQPTPAKKGNRALWMAAGAIACVCVLGAAIYTLPNLLKSPSASSKPDSGRGNTAMPPKDRSAATATTPPAIAPPGNRAAAVNPPASKQEGAAAGLSAGVAVKSSGAHRSQQIASAALASNKGVPASNPHTPALPSTPAGFQQTAPAAQPVQQPVAAASISQEERDKADEDFMKLRARADAVRGSLNNLRAQQASQGVGLRPDVAAAASRMDSYLQAADRALQSGRMDFARKNMEHADEDITKIEAFFGR